MGEEGTKPLNQTLFLQSCHHERLGALAKRAVPFEDVTESLGHAISRWLDPKVGTLCGSYLGP